MAFCPAYGRRTTYSIPFIRRRPIAGLFKPNTKAVLVEAGRLAVLEIRDIPRSRRGACARALVIDDNTWATAALSPPLGSVRRYQMQAATNMSAGHSDIMVVNHFATPEIRGGGLSIDTSGRSGYSSCSQVPRRVSGRCACFRTLAGRLGAAPSIRARDRAHGSDPARGPQGVLHPALESYPGPCDPGNGNFTGASGPVHHSSEPAQTQKKGRRACSMPQLFGMGYSWGASKPIIPSIAHPTHCHQMGAGRGRLGGFTSAGECRHLQSRSRARFGGVNAA